MKKLNEKQIEEILEISILIANDFDTDRKDVKNRKKISKIEDSMFNLLYEMAEKILELNEIK